MGRGGAGRGRMQFLISDFWFLIWRTARTGLLGRRQLNPSRRAKKKWVIASQFLEARAGAGEVEFFGEDIFSRGFGDGTEAIEDGDGGEGGEGFAGLAKAEFGAGDPLLEGVFIHAHDGRV
jgi:hypothetical protein